MLRNLRADDKAAFISLCKAFYTSKAVLHTVPHENFSRTFDLIMNGDPFSRGLAIEQDGKMVGYGLLSFTYSNEAGGLVVLLEEAYILPEYQGHGLGGEFLDYVEQEYKDKARRLRLEVTRTNLGAMRLYERHGFEVMDYMQMIKELD